METPWYHPLLLEPWFQDSAAGPIRIPLDGPPVALVLWSGPNTFDRFEDPEASGIARVMALLAPFAPDCRVIVHHQEDIRQTLRRLEVAELVIQRGTLEVVHWPITDLIERTRWLGLMPGAQWLAFPTELLIALASRSSASSALLDHAAAEVAAELVATIEEAPSNGVSTLFDVSGRLHHAAALEALGRGSATLTALTAELRAVAAPFETELLEALIETRGGRSSVPAAELDALAVELGHHADLHRLLAEAGPGMVVDGAILFAPAAMIEATRRARTEDGWPTELVVIGDARGARLCLDTRYRPAPVVRELARHTFVEDQEGLFQLLAWGRLDD